MKAKIEQAKDKPNPPMLIYNIDGKIEPITLTKDITIEECWKYMGGYIEKFYEDEIYYYFADEEGLLKHLPMNQSVSIIEICLKLNIVIVGKVLAIPKRWFK